MGITLKLMQEDPVLLGLEPQSSTMLRFLALHAGKAVTVETLKDLLSADPDAPKTDQSIYNTKNRILRKLGDDGAGRIGTDRRPARYTLGLQEGDYLDIAEFASLEKNSASLAAEGDWAGAIKDCDKALTMWEANPARGIDFNLIDDPNLNHDEAHFAAIYAKIRLRWAECLTSLGDTHRMTEVIEELDKLAKSQWLSEYDERMWRLRSHAHVLQGNVSLAVDLFDQYSNLGAKPSRVYITLIESAEEGGSGQLVNEERAGTGISFSDGLRTALKSLWSDHASRTVAGSQRLRVGDLTDGSGLWIAPQSLDLSRGAPVEDTLADLVTSLSAPHDPGSAGRKIVLGSPGLGKSTLGLRIFKGLLDAWISGECAHVPFYLDLRSVKAYAADDLMLRDFVQMYMGQTLFSQSASAKWGEALRELSPIVIVDSVDEFFLGRSRQQVQQLMRAPLLLEASVLLCRSQFYAQYIQGTELATRFSAIELSPWARDNRDAYIMAYYEHFFPSQAEPLSDELQARLRRSTEMAQVCSAPVRLNMALDLFSPGDDKLPEHVDLLSLYKHYLGYVLATDAARAGSTTDADEKLEIMKELAWRYYDEGSMGEADAPLFSRSELRSFLEDFFPQRSEDERHLVFLDLLDSSLLESTKEHRLEIGSNLLHFSHKSFQEYFVATRVYESMIHDVDAVLEVMRPYLSPEVSEFLKEHIKRVNRYPRLRMRVATNGVEAIERLTAERSDSGLDDRLRIALEQSYYYIGGLELPEVQDKLTQYLEVEADPWLRRGLAIGLSFSGQYGPVDAYIAMLRAERESLGEAAPENSVNVGTKLSYFGDQPFAPEKPEIDRGSSNCGRTVATLLYQLATETERGCWRIDLYSLVDLWRWRPICRETYAAALQERAGEVQEVVAALRSDGFSSGWQELSEFAEIATGCGITDLE